jgi:type IV secretion system protein VirB10
MSDREAPAPQPKRGGMSGPQKITAYGIATAGLVGFIFWKNPTGQPEPAPSGGPATIESALITFRTPPPEAPPRPQPSPAPAAAEVPQARPQPGGATAEAPAAPRGRMTSFTPAEPYPYAKPATPAAGAPGGPAGAGGAAGGAAQETRVAFAGSTIPGRRVGAAMDMTFVLRPGVYTCTLQTAVNSERPGPFFCLTDKPIRSQAGVLLMEKGTTITGSYDSQVSQGQERINAMHAFAITPSGIPVPLGATAGDGLGRAGISGDVNTHWRERFGSAALLLLSQGAMNVAQEAVRSQLASSGSSSTSINIQGSGLDRAVSDALGAGRAIQNTITKNQGEQISFLVVEPVDFSPALSLEVR